MQYFMVLNDGETYTDLPGCKIVAIENEAVNTAEDGWLNTLDELIEEVANGANYSFAHIEKVF